MKKVYIPGLLLSILVALAMFLGQPALSYQGGSRDKPKDNYPAQEKRAPVRQEVRGLSGRVFNTAAPANDNFANAEAISGNQGTISGSNEMATKEPGEPNHHDIGGASVWYRWEAPGNGQVIFDTANSNFDTLLSIYTGAAVNDLTRITSDDESGPNHTSIVSFNFTANTTYYVAVDGYFGSTGNIALNWMVPQPPSNDNFANAQIINGAAGTLTASNVGATREEGEPRPAGAFGDATVWYRWQAPASGPITFDTAGSNFDTVLGVYTGTAVNALTEIASDDESGPGSTSSLTFTAAEGSIYYVTVVGYFDPGTGNITLNWGGGGPTPTPTPTPSPSPTPIPVPTCGGPIFPSLPPTSFDFAVSESLELADFNGDGELDAAWTLNSPGATVNVAFGNGQGGFGIPVVLLVERNPAAIVASDFNNDGRADLAVANSGADSVSVFITNGGSFSVARVPVGFVPVGLAAADFNGDGRTDLAVANFISDDVSLLLNDGNGNFRVAASFDVGNGPEGIAVGDLNGDGKLDLLTVNRLSSSVSVLTGDGNGGFAPAREFAAGARPVEIAVADFNGDRRSDVAVVSPKANALSILLADGSGGLGSARDLTVAGTPQDVVAGDVNGDGKIDLVVAQKEAGTVAVFLGDGTGLFTASGQFIVGGAPTALAVSDLNRDGRQDVVLHNGRVAGLFGDSDAGLSGFRVFPVGDGPVHLAVADVNGDGLPDVATANFDHDTVSILLGDGHGGFAPARTFPAGDRPQSVAFGDFNNDGRLDLAVASPSSFFFSESFNPLVLVLLGDGTGNFTVIRELHVDLSPQVVAVSDFNNDGKSDLVVGTQTGVIVLPGDGAGDFGPMRSYQTGANVQAIVVGDFNQDAVDDLAVAHRGLFDQEDHNISILLGDGTGGFTGPNNIDVNGGTKALAIGDFNRDNKQDLAALVYEEFFSGHTVSILLGDGAGGFGAPRAFTVDDDPNSVAVGDFNRDGSPDLVTSNLGILASSVSVLLGDGVGGFLAFDNYTVQSAPSSVAVADLNSDQKQDLVLAIDNGSNSNVTVLLYRCEGGPRLRVNSPPSIAGSYQVGTAEFGSSLNPSGVTADVVQALDPSDDSGFQTTDACSSLTNAAAVAGKIALIDRGSCLFVTKVKNAQNAGAIGVIIVNNVEGSPPPPLAGSDPTITIPAVSITLADGNTIKSQLGPGVNASLLVEINSNLQAKESGGSERAQPTSRKTRQHTRAEFARQASRLFARPPILERAGLPTRRRG